MPTTSQDPAAKGTKQMRTAGVQPLERTGENAENKARTKQEERRETTSKRDKERSDWEGMTEKPEQGEDDAVAPGELPETD